MGAGGEPLPQYLLLIPSGEQHHTCYFKVQFACTVCMSCAMQIAAGVIPALLLLCCGLEGPSKGLQAAVAAAAAAAAKPPTRPQTAGSINTDASSAPGTCVGDGADGSARPGSSGSGSGDAAAPADGKSYTRRPTFSSGGAAGEAGHVGEVLDSIAEPAHAAEGEEDGECASGAGDSSRGTSAASGACKDIGGAKAGAKKGGKKKGKKPAKLEPAMIEAQSHASAAVKLLAIASDLARSSLLSAGALLVLLPLVDGGVSQARWNARQVGSSAGAIPSTRHGFSNLDTAIRNKTHACCNVARPRTAHSVS